MLADRNCPERHVDFNTDFLHNIGVCAYENRFLNFTLNKLLFSLPRPSRLAERVILCFFGFINYLRQPPQIIIDLKLFNLCHIRLPPLGELFLIPLITFTACRLNMRYNVLVPVYQIICFC